MLLPFVVLSSFAIVSLRNRELVSLLYSCSWCNRAAIVLCLFWSMVCDCCISMSHALAFLRIIYIISVLFWLCFRDRLFIDALWSPAGLTSWLSFVTSYCEVITFPLVSWIRCGTWLYRFLNFAIFLTFFYCACLSYIWQRLFIDALWSLAGKGLTSWLSFVMSNCDVVTFPLVSWVRCGAWLYRFLIFALVLSLIM